MRATHHGYAYQDLLSGVALVDLVLGTAEAIAIDTKGFPGDRFDDLSITYRTGQRLRIQIKHTSVDRELSRDSFTGDRRSLRLDLLFDALLTDLRQHPQTAYRVIVRDGNPDNDLAEVLKPVDQAHDPGTPLRGIVTRRFRFDPVALLETGRWRSRLANFSGAQVREACAHLTVDTEAPASTLDFTSPGPAERVLLRRVIEELGAGRPPNTHLAPEHAALALAHAAASARATNGQVARDVLLPRVGLTTDFGAVSEGHPVEAAVAVSRVGAIKELRTRIDEVSRAGGRIVASGEPGVGKSWLCEQLAATYRAADWTVARHHCWLGWADVDRHERVLTDVVVGSLLRQLEQVVPEATAGLQPRFAATREALAASVQACRAAHPERNVLLIVDGLDHVDRVVGQRTGEPMYPSRVLVDQLAEIDLPPGVCMLIASQPGPHLDNADPVSTVGVSRMSREEVAALAARHGLSDELADGVLLSESEESAVVDLVYERSDGNALYATYLCRYAAGVSPLGADRRTPATAKELLHRLELVPETANDLDAYYAHLMSGMSRDQEFAVGTLALCDFALTVDELGEIVPVARPLLRPALTMLAPILNSQPGLGGLRVHHESFSRHILRGKDEEWVTVIRESAANWLSARGFFNDARAFRHLPQLLARLDRYDELKELIQPGFVAESIRAFQPPAALVGVVGVVARESQARLDWPTLITCVETRKAVDTYESESLVGSIVEYADVVTSIVGADVVADRLIYEGRPTFPPRWGLRICHAVDRAGSAAPWQTYIDARDAEARNESSTYSSDNDGTLQLATQLGALRLRSQRGDPPADLAERVAKHLEFDHEASLEDLVEVFAAGLPAGVMPDIAASMTDPDKAARVFMALANLAALGEPGLPSRTELARRAWRLAPANDVAGLLRHGISAADVLSGLGTADLETDLHGAAEILLGSRTADYSSVRRWLSLLTLAHALDRTRPMRHAAALGGTGFYRAWLRYATATVGVAEDVASGSTTATEASSAVVVALEELAAHAHPFTGQPRACDLYFVHPLVHEVIEASLVVLQPDDLDAALEHLIAVGDGTTTTSNLGTPESGPLTTTALLGILSRVSDHIGADATHALMTVVRGRRNDSHTEYGVTANFELEAARICVAAGAAADADECWRRASELLASYGGHKDPTIAEITDSLDDLADVGIGTARICLEKLVDLVYLVSQHTDGRGTSHFVDRWWEKVALVDPAAAALDGAAILLGQFGFQDGRVETAHTQLLESRTATADPIVLAALRLTAGSGWRNPDVDLELLARLESELSQGQRSVAMVGIAATNIAASYDEQAMMYSSDNPRSTARTELIEAIVRLGGPSFSARSPRPDRESASRPDPQPKADPHELLKALVNDQPPTVPEGHAGVAIAARDYDRQSYRDDVAQRWEFDALVNAIGWRVLGATFEDGSRAGIELIDVASREISVFSDNELFAAVGEGLADRCDGACDALHTVASYCLTVAYVRIRGRRGWQRFAGRERVELWNRAHELDAITAERTLAAAVAASVDTDAHGTYGVTQAIVAAFASTPTGTDAGTAVACWEAAFSVISHRLPGTAERFGHVYRPTGPPERQDTLDAALATLALASIARPMRSDLRQTLVAAMILLTCRPKLAQAAFANVLAFELDAGRASWLLEILRTHLPPADLDEELESALSRLAACDRLSVRNLAGQVLARHGRPLPALPATEPAREIRAACQERFGDAD